MSALTAAEAGAILTGPQTIATAWDIYRHSQSQPFSGDLLRLQVGLFRLLDAYTRTDDRGFEDVPDFSGIRTHALVLALFTGYGKNASSGTGGCEAA